MVHKKHSNVFPLFYLQQNFQKLLLPSVCMPIRERSFLQVDSPYILLYIEFSRGSETVAGLRTLQWIRHAVSDQTCFITALKAFFKIKRITVIKKKKVISISLDSPVEKNRIFILAEKSFSQSLLRDTGFCKQLGYTAAYKGSGH